MSQISHLFMERALELASLGRQWVSPNPMVGCVIVHDGKIIGEGWHQQYGGPHAEVNAINAVEDQELLKWATAYVTLEPCSHHGKTPPCADLLISKQIKKVVICNLDPNPLVAGRGIAKLKEAGIEVESGLLEEKGLELNKRFFTFFTKKRPYIILKWAQTADGFIARENFDSKWISGDLSRKLVHQWRAEEDAIMVGTNTALHDNLALNVRDWQGNSPVRILLDRSLRIPKSHKLFDQTQVTLIYNDKLSYSDGSNHYIQIDVEQNIFAQILEDLYTRKIMSVIVEGGTHLLNTILKEGVWDEVRLFQAPVKFVKGIVAPVVNGILIGEEKIGEDQLVILRKV